MTSGGRNRDEQRFLIYVAILEAESHIQPPFLFLVLLYLFNNLLRRFSNWGKINFPPLPNFEAGFQHCQRHRPRIYRHFIWLLSDIATIIFGNRDPEDLFPRNRISLFLLTVSYNPAWEKPVCSGNVTFIYTAKPESSASSRTKNSIKYGNDGRKSS